MPEWIVISSPDRDARHSGVAIFLRRVRFPEQPVSHVVWIPGRLLHVRCSSPRTTLDVIAGYQYVWQEKNNESTVLLRHHFWLKLGLLLPGLSARHLQAIAADLNTHCRPVPSHVGPGVMRATRKPDLELEEIRRERDLVLLNTWGRAAPGRCCTFENGDTASQLHFICTRRSQADTLSRQSSHCPRRRPLQRQMSVALQGPSPVNSVRELNRRLLPVCQSLFPSQRRQKPAVPGQEQVAQSIAHMWSAYRALRVPGPYLSIARASAAYRNTVAFQEACKALRQASRQKRRLWFEEQISAAGQAASGHDMGAVYTVVNKIAPRKCRDKVRIRAEQGHLLSALSLSLSLPLSLSLSLSFSLPF